MQHILCDRVTLESQLSNDFHFLFKFLEQVSQKL